MVKLIDCFFFFVFFLQRYLISLGGPVVTATGFGDELAVVTHSSPSLPSNEQMLDFGVYNVSNGTQPIRGRLPLTPGSCLTWFGFSEEGQLSSYDSMVCLNPVHDFMLLRYYLCEVQLKKT